MFEYSVRKVRGRTIYAIDRLRTDDRELVESYLHFKRSESDENPDANFFPEGSNVINLRMFAVFHKLRERIRNGG